MKVQKNKLKHLGEKMVCQLDKSFVCKNVMILKNVTCYQDIFKSISKNDNLLKYASYRLDVKTKKFRNDK